MIFEGESPVQVKRGYIDGFGDKFIELASPWPYTDKVSQPIVTYPTDASFAEATAELRRVIDTLEVASTVDMQAATNDTKIATPLKVKQAIDFNTGTAATRDVGESAGNLMEVGAFGLGTNGSIIPNDNIGNIDLNQLGITGFYFCGPSSTLTNAPPDAVGSSDYGYLTVISGNANGRMCQEFTWSRYAQNSNIKFIRAYVNDTNTWTDWEKVYTTGNILGTVSQSGGVPTGAIIERGSNVNGSYTKYADGTIKMWGNITYPDNTQITTPSAGGFRSAGLTYPLPFSAIVSGSASAVANKAAGDDIFASYGLISGTNIVIILERVTSGSTGAGLGIGWQVMARWF